MASGTSPFLHDVPAASAQSAWRECCAAAGCPPRLDAVTVPVDSCVGRVTAAPIAVRAAETAGASETTPLLLDTGAFVEIDTGDPLPDGFDAVVMREHVHYVDGRAELRGAVAPYQHTRSIGEDISATELLLPAGHRLRPVDAAAAAAAGATEVRVHRQPVVAILPTGDEVRPIGSELEPGELLETNSLMLAGQAREITAGQVQTVDGVCGFVGEAETAADDVRHEEHEQGSRAVEAEPLPHFRKEKGSDASGLAENLPVFHRRSRHGIHDLVHLEGFRSRGVVTPAIVCCRFPRASCAGESGP